MMGKILGDQTGRENSMSPKRDGKFVIESRPEEMSANKELFKSPTKLTGKTTTKSPKRSGLGISPSRERELGRTQMKLLRSLDSGKKAAAGSSNIVTSQAKKTRDIMMKKEYEVKFPAGAMGLELEPVIISTERKIGCRVKDFYFGLGYSGIDPSILQKTIRVGDVISSVDGTSMLSEPFMDILEVLTSKRENPIRHLWFKDISSQWAPALASSGSSKGIHEENSDAAALENHSMDVIPPHTSDKSSTTSSTTTTAAAAVGGGRENMVQTPIKKEASAQLPLTPETSPAMWKTYPATPDMFAPAPLLQDVTPTPTHSRRKAATVDFALTVSPKAVKALSVSRAISRGTTPMKATVGGGTAAALSKEVSREDLGKVLGRVGASIGYGLKGVGQRILEPFSELEAKDREIAVIMGRKHELLSELSRSCHLLGVAEEKEHDLLSRLDEAKEGEIEAKTALVVVEEQLREARDCLRRVQEEQEQGQEADNEALLSARDRASQLETTVGDLETVNTGLTEELDSWRSVVEENQRAYTTAQEELASVRRELHSAQQEVVIERSVRDHDKEEWQQRVEQTEQEKSETLMTMEQAVQEANKRRNVAEEAREKATAEAEFLRDTMGTERASVHSELQRVKTQLSELQQSHKEELLALVEEKEGAVAALKASESELREQAEALGVNLEGAVQAKDAAEALSHERKASAEQLEGDLSASREALGEAKRREARLRQCYLVHQHHMNKRTAALDAARASKDLDWKDFEIAMGEKSTEAAELKQQLLAASHDAVALETQLRQARQDREDLVTRFHSSSESKEESYHSALIEAQREQDRLRNEKEELSIKMAALEGTIVEQLSSLEASQSEEAGLQQRLNDAESSSNALQRATEEYKAKAAGREEELCLQLSRAEESLKEWQERLGMLRLEKEEESQSHLKTLGESEAQVQSHEALWREEKERAILLEDAKRSLEEELETAQFAWETRNIDCETLEAKLVAAESDKKETEMRLEEERHVHRRSSDEKEELLGLTEAHKGELSAQLEREKTKQRQCVTTASKACEELSWELKDVRNSVLDLGALEKEYVGALRMMEAKYGGVVAALEGRLSEQAQGHAEEVETLQQSIERLTADRDTLLRSAESRTADSDEKMAVTFARAREAETLLEAAYDEHEELRQQISVLQIQLNKGSGTVSSLEEELEFLRESASQAREKYEETVAFTEEQKFAVVHLRGELARTAKALEMAETDKANAQSSLAQVGEEHRISVEEVDALNELLRTTKNEYKRCKADYQRKADGMLESQRDLVAEQTMAEEHHQTALRARVAEAAEAMERALDAMGAEFEEKQAMLLEEHATEMDNTQKRARREAEKAREASESVQGLESTLKALREDKRKVENMLMSQDEALSVSEGRVDSLKEEIDTLEQARDEAVAELKQARSTATAVPTLEATLAEKSAALDEAVAAAESFAQREADLVKQREDLMETLKSQHSNLTVAAEEKDAALAAMQEEYSQLLGQMEAALRGQRQAEADVEARTVEAATLRARIAHIAASNDSNQESNIASQDVVKKMATALSESKALLKVSVGENKTLLEQREAMTQALKDMRQSLSTAAAERDSACEKTAVLESTVSESSGSITTLSSRLEAMQGEYETKNSALEAQLKQLGQQVAAANTANLSAQQQVAAKQAELDALHRQCTDLIAAAMASPESSPSKARPGRPWASSYDEDENDENLCPALGSPQRDRRVLGELPSAQRDGDTSAENLAISDLSSTDSQDAAVAGLSMTEAVRWHERLLCFALDMHEAITFATAEDFAAQEGIGETPKVSPPLRMASEALRSLHEHVLLAPWLDSTSVVPQSLPPAHEMLDALRQPEEQFHSSSSSSSSGVPEDMGAGSDADQGDMFAELANARETIGSLQQRLADVISMPDLKRQDSGFTINTLSNHQSHSHSKTQHHCTISQSERIYGLMEELQELLNSKLELGVDVAGAADTSMDSLQLGGEGAVWRNLHTQAADILTHYRVAVMHKAVSKSSSLDRFGSDASGSRTPSPRARTASGTSGTSTSFSPRTSSLVALTEDPIASSADMNDSMSSSNSSVATGGYNNHVRLSSESADMPRLASSVDSLSLSLPRMLAPMDRESLTDGDGEGITLGEIVAMTSRHASVDTSVDSINSQDLSFARPFVVRPIATMMSSTHEEQSQELSEGTDEQDHDNSDEVEREDSGFWNVSAASIDPLSDVEGEQSFDMAP